MAHVGVSPSKGLKLFGREIIFEVFQPMEFTVPKRYRLTDGGAERQTTYCDITALSAASRGKNRSPYNISATKRGIRTKCHNIR